jgi:hypothetical protein
MGVLTPHLRTLDVHPPFKINSAYVSGKSLYNISPNHSDSQAYDNSSKFPSFVRQAMQHFRTLGHPLFLEK